MKKYLLSISILSIILLQCATPQDIKTRMHDEDYTFAVTYNYNWETVYSAIEFVFEHSKIRQIAGRRLNYNIAFDKDDKTIWVTMPLDKSIDFTVYALWKREIPAPNPAIQRYCEALSVYRFWLQNEERKKIEYWFSLSGHRFEKEFGIILRNNGYSISVTRGSADGGVDIVAKKGRKNIIMQCKAHKSPIGPGPIRELFGVLSSGDFKAKSAIVVCLSGFTRGAREFAVNNNIELWDITDVLRLAKRTNDDT